MAIPTFLSTFEGNLVAETRDGPTTLTSSGPVRYVQGAVAGPEPERVNLVPNPQFDDDGTAWIVGGCEVSQDAAVTKNGVPSGAIVSSDTLTESWVQSNTPDSTLSAGQPFTFTAQVRASVEGVTAYLYMLPRDSGGGSLGFIGNSASRAIAVTTDPNDWTLISVDTDALPAGASRASVYIRSENLPVGETLWVVQPQAEIGDTATSYIDGSLGDGYRWLGTPHASPSLRESWANGGTRAYVAEEGTTNIVPNPWHAIDAAGWTGTTRDTAYAVQGPASGLITASGAGAEATIDVTASAATHTVQAIVRNNAASARTFQLRYNSTDAGDAVAVAAGAVRTITASVTGTGSSAALGVQVTDSEAAETYNVGYLGCEQKAYATSPCPAIAANGDMGAGYSWAGTAHASASTRDAASASVSYIETFGEFAVRYSDDGGSSWETLFLADPGEIGDYAELALSSDVLTIASEQATYVDALVGFGRPLTSAERQRLMTAPAWEWDTLIPRFGGIHVSVPIEPIAVAVSVPVDVTGG